MKDIFNLERFVLAQNPVYEDVLAELKSGRKTSHWMWFVFPQLKGLGSSPMSRQFAISSLDEARAYLQHPVLGARLSECCRLVVAIEGKSIHEIFGYPDDLKFHSCVTLFAQADPGNSIFKEALEKYFSA
jgi:uncharacterized protein (DUF1810 family)